MSYRLSEAERAMPDEEYIDDKPSMFGHRRVIFGCGCRGVSCREEASLIPCPDCAGTAAHGMTVNEYNETLKGYKIGKCGRTVSCEFAEMFPYTYG